MWDNRLVAYLVARVSSPRPGIPEIQAHLSRWIPAYAIPTFYQWVAGLPLNSNGKIARNLLPAPDWQSLLTEGEWVAPSTQTEEVLVQILKENLAFLSLSLEPTSSKIDVSRTFGQLGLDSLSATNYILSAQPHFTHIIHLDEGRLLRLTPIQLGHMLDNQEI
jgi:hypothetical protein